MNLFEDGTDILQVLKGIEKRTGLFILNRNLDYLYNFIRGYIFFANSAKIEIKNIDKLDQFPSFLKRELNEDYENTMGWFGYLHDHFGSTEGFEKFFEYFNKFKSENKY